MNSRAKQTRFSDSQFKVKDQFGGSLLKKKANRTARPLSTKQSMHLVLKSSIAKGRFSLRAPKNYSKIESIIKNAAAKNGVKLIRYSNNFNHLHLHVKITSRETYKRFIKSISGAIAMAVTGARKSKSIASAIGQKKFWDARPFSRITRGWRGFKTANDYVKLNQLEAEGIVPKRELRLRGLTPGERRYFRPEQTVDPTRSEQLGFW
jgi:REP element-mobilizing transposase RayT